MNTSLPQVARVVSVARENAQIVTLVLDLHLEAEPGQFVMAWLPGTGEKPFSLVHDRPVTLTVARVGPFSAALCALAPGDRLWIRGPLGRPFTLPSFPSPTHSQSSSPDSPIPDSPIPRSPLLLVAGGYGVAPMHFLTGRAVARGLGVDVVIGARTAGDVIFADRLAALGAGVTVATDDGSLGRRGLATEAAAGLLARGAYRQLYACGPEAMLAAVERLAVTHRLPAQLSYERTMRCGFGVCGTCSREGWLVCRDGPVREVDCRL